MIRVECPTCRKPFAIERPADLPSFPFCSERCRLVDLGRWLDGEHAIPGPSAPGHAEGAPPPLSPPDDEDD